MFVCIKSIGPSIGLSKCNSAAKFTMHLGLYFFKSPVTNSPLAISPLAKI